MQQPEPEADEVSPISGVLTPELAADTAWCTKHAAQLRSINLPAQLASPLARKLRLQQFDAGESIGFGWTDGHDTARDSWFIAATRDIPSESDVWLSDHVWLIPSVLEARAQIAGNPELATRLWMLLGTAEEGDPEPDADTLLALIAPLAHPIKFATSDGSTGSQMHYVADEFGSRITLVPVGGEAAPNVNFAAIYDEQSQRTYSVVWPCGDISQGEALQRVATPSLELIAEGGQEYWERRFDAEEKFDWYCGWDAIERTVLDTVTSIESDAKVTVLVTGNGNSPLPVELEAAVNAHVADGGLGKECDIIAVDYVESVVDRMRARYPPEQTAIQWLAGDLTNWSSFDGEKMAVNIIIDKAVAERERPEDTWITDVDSPHAAGALAYLTGCAAALRRAGSGAMVLVTLGRQEYRAPLLKKAGLSVVSFERIEPTESMRCGEHNDAWAKLVIARPA